MKQKRFILQENELPTAWYNIQADMPNKPMPLIHPATRQPLGVDGTTWHASFRVSVVFRNWTTSMTSSPSPTRSWINTRPIVLRRSFALMRSRRYCRRQLTYISRMSRSTRWAHTRSTRPWPSATMPNKKERPTSLPRPVRASGAQPWPMPLRSSDWNRQSIR